MTTKQHTKTHRTMTTLYTTYDGDTIKDTKTAKDAIKKWMQIPLNMNNTDVYRWNLEDAITGINKQANLTMEMYEAIGELKKAYFTYTGKAFLN